MLILGNDPSIQRKEGVILTMRENSKRGKYRQRVFYGVFGFCLGMALSLPVGAQTPTPTATPVYSYPGPLPWQVVMEADQAWEDGQGVEMPWVIFDDGLYRMYYRVSPPSSAGSEGGKIAYAESVDGTSWTGKQLLFESGALLGPERSLRRPVVLKVGTEYRMYNTQYYLSAPEWSEFVTLRTSSDGLSWSTWQTVLAMSGKQAWELDNFNVRAVFEEPGGGFRMFYRVRYSLSASPDSYWATATSSDGVNWSNRQQVLGQDGQPLFAHPQAWYFTFDLTETGMYRCLYADGSGDLQIAESSDGIHWNRGTGGYLGVVNLNTALASPPAGAYGGCVVRPPAGGEYLYFWPQQGLFKIGRATLSTPVLEWKQY